MNAREHLYWLCGSTFLAGTLLSLTIFGWFFGMPARELFAFIAFVAMMPLIGSIRIHWKGLRLPKSR